MRILRCVATGTVLLIMGGCADGPRPLGPTALEPSASRQPAAQPASGARQVQATGNFDALVDFSTLQLTPRGRNCLLQVKGQLIFHGTIEGVATGETTALEFAPCSEVAAVPAGTFADVFHSVAVFEGTVAGAPARANLRYMGRVQPGGMIDGRFVFSNGVAGRLDVVARVAVGGDYSGSVVVR